MVPSVDINMPLNPATFRPTAMAQFTAIAPGLDWAIAIRSNISSSSIQCSSSTNFFFMNVAITKPPPKVKELMYSVLKNNLDILFFIVYIINIKNCYYIDMKKRLYFIRHGQTEFNTRGIAQGRVNSNLTQKGMNQALALKKYIEEKQIEYDKVFVSPLKRTSDTSFLVTGEYGEIVDDLTEVNYGDLDGKDYHLCLECNGDYTSHGGENLKIAGKRMYDALRKIMEENDRVLVFSHSACGRAFYNYINGYVDSPFRIPNCGIVTYDYDDGKFNFVDVYNPLDIKYVFSDLDNTLFGKNKVLSENKIEMLKKIKDKGIKFIINSGRLPYDTEFLGEHIDISNLVSGNGSYIRLNNEVIYNCPCNKEDVISLIEYGLKKHITPRVYFIDGIYTYEEFYTIFNIKYYVIDYEKLIEKANKEDVYKICFMSEDSEALQDIKEYAEGLKECIGDYSTPRFLECHHKDTSKGEAINKICEYANIKHNQVLVVGDNQNDLSMFNKDFHSACPFNATDSIKQLAEYISNKTCDEDGIVDILKYFCD